MAQKQVRVPNLVVEVRDRPAEHKGKEILQDVLGNFLGGRAVPVLLYKPLGSALEEARPVRLNALDAMAVRGEILELGRHANDE
jgi:hypothetical protein